MVRCVDVHKSYQLGQRRVEALRGLSLEINESGFYGVMGASGSGKSTLLHLIAALDTPDQGEVSISGRRINDLSERELTMFRRREIGIIFQQFNLIPTMTAKQNVQLPGLLAGESQKQLDDRSDELLEALGVGDRKGHRPDALSGGEQQRVAIARALFFSPGLLLADEPTGNLDSRSSDELWALLAEIAQQHDLTVVMVTHEPSAATHCRRIFVLNDGVITGHFETEGLDVSGVATRYQQLVG